MSSSFRRGGKPLSSTRGTNFRRPASAGTGNPETAPSSSTVLERSGTKQWIGGLTLTSLGLRELDAICGGGQPLGTAILIEEDRWTQDLALAIVRYWTAEAASQQHSLSLVATTSDLTLQDLSILDDVDDVNLSPTVNIQQGMSPKSLRAFLSFMPRNLHTDKIKAKEAAHQKQQEQNQAAIDASATAMSQQFAIIEENDDFDEEDENDDVTTEEQHKRSDEGLTNAWQYKVSVQRQRGAAPMISTPKRLGGVRTYCHSYDLSGKMEDQHSPNWIDDSINLFSIVDCSSLCSRKNSSSADRACGIRFYQTCLKHILEQVATHSNGVIRVLLMNAPVRTTSIAIPLLLSYIRSHNLPVVILLTVRPWIRQSSAGETRTNPQSLVHLRRSCDAVFTCEGFDAVVNPPPPEFSDLMGIFSIRKMALQSLSHFTDSTTNRRPPANRYGMKRDRRKLHIRMLHLPPEDFSAGGSSVGSGVRSGAGRAQSQDSGKKTSSGMGCGSNLKQNNSSSLDF